MKKNKSIIGMVVICILIVIFLSLGLYNSSKIIENPTDGIGGLHNLESGLQALLFYTITIACTIVEVIMIFVFKRSKKNKK